MRLRSRWEYSPHRCIKELINSWICSVVSPSIGSDFPAQAFPFPICDRFTSTSKSIRISSLAYFLSTSKGMQYQPHANTMIHVIIAAIDKISVVVTLVIQSHVSWSKYIGSFIHDCSDKVRSYWQGEEQKQRARELKVHIQNRAVETRKYLVCPMTRFLGAMLLSEHKTQNHQRCWLS